MTSDGQSRGDGAVAEPRARPPAPWLGIFVGGRSLRMGGRAKGLLIAPDTGETLIERTARLGRNLGLQPMLVGRADDYRDLLPDVPRLVDAPAGIGPLGGLNALLQHAAQHGDGLVITVACDMPNLDAAVLTRLRDWPRKGAVVAARRAPDAPFEAFLARYRLPGAAPRVADAIRRGVRSFQGLFADMEAETFLLAGDLARAAEDWDRPEDMAAAVTPKPA